MAIYNIPYTEKMDMVREFIAGTFDIEYHAAKFNVTKITFRQHLNRWVKIEYKKKIEQQEIESSWYYKKDLSFSERLNLAVNG